MNYTQYPKPTDTTTLKPHLKEIERLYSVLPEVVVADAGYGSEETYIGLEELKIAAYLNIMHSTSVLNPTSASILLMTNKQTAIIAWLVKNSVEPTPMKE